MPHFQRWTRPAAVVFVMVLAGTISASQAQSSSSRGSFTKPPYVHGKPAVTGHVGHVTVTYRDVPASLDPTPDRSAALAAVLDSMRAELDRMGLTTAVALDPRASGAPDVAFGVVTGGVSVNGAVLAPDEVDPDAPRRMAFMVEGPSKRWREQLRAASGKTPPPVVTIQLGFGDYWVRQKNLKGDKVIDLGTGRSMSVPWLTSLDDPVQVLQITGALVMPDGKVARVGAEGLIARRTGMTASALGAQEVLTEDDLSALTDSSNGTPVWREALRTLVAGLVATPQ